MAIQVIFRYQSPDSTAYLNQRLASLITKGVYDGGYLSPVGGGSLSAIRLPFLAVGKDGVTIADPESATVTYTAGIVNYHCILAKYNPYGTPSTPVVSELILSAAAYAAHVDQAYMIILAIVTPTTELLLSHIDYSSRDSIGPFGHAWLKGTVATTASLPVSTPTALAANKVGDCYLVQSNWGIYTWTGTAWRLTCALGASTLDGAYDDSNGSAIPGAGRQITVDAGAVELIQSTASQRQNDLANAALRINKMGSTTYGDIGLDIKTQPNYDLAAILCRALYTSGTDLQANEDVDIIDSTSIQGTRAGVAWNAVLKADALLVEISGSAIGNNGLYLVDIISANHANLRSLNGAPTSLVVEPSIIANFFSVRFSTGSAKSTYHNLAYGDLGAVSVGSIEYWGNSGSVSGIGKLWYFDASSLGYVLQIRKSDAGVGTASSLLASIDDDGLFYSKGGFFGEVSSALGYAVHGINTLNTAVYGKTDSTAALSNNHAGVHGDGGLYNFGVYGTSVEEYSAGVKGKNSAVAYGYGVYGHSTASSGVGIFGVGAVGVHGATFGVSANDVGVKGYAAGLGWGGEFNTIKADTAKTVTWLVPLTCFHPMFAEWDVSNAFKSNTPNARLYGEWKAFPYGIKITKFHFMYLNDAASPVNLTISLSKRNWSLVSGVPTAETITSLFSSTVNFPVSGSSGIYTCTLTAPTNLIHANDGDTGGDDFLSINFTSSIASFALFKMWIQGTHQSISPWYGPTVP
jgi:hypothetical protein